MKACSIRWCVSLAAEGSDKCVLHKARPKFVPESAESKFEEAGQPAPTKQKASAA